MFFFHTEETKKAAKQKNIHFQLVTLDPDGINEQFDEFTRIFTLPSQVLCPRFQTNKNPNSSIRSDEGLTLQTPALKFLRWQLGC